SMEKYSLDKVIGEGSFGRALLVRCKNTQDEYVLKEIQLPKNPSKLDSWRREAVLLSGMKHPNIVAFREAFEADGLLCVIMEYCSGGDLLQRILRQENTHFCTDDILQWFAQLCAATQHVHNKRVLHRDLKSKNIFLTDDGTVKLGDFGSACVLNSPRAYAQTYVGTPYYVAPEIWENKPYNNKSDVWSLGCVLYELCTLRHPFQAPSWKSLILKICRGAYPPLPGHLPYELRVLVKQMFKINPKDRPSVHTILTSHRVSRLLRARLPSQVRDSLLRLFLDSMRLLKSAKLSILPQSTETEEGGRRTGRWNRDEGMKVAKFLGEKSLMKESFEDFYQCQGLGAEALPESGERRRRKQWAEPSHSVLQKLANASVISSDSLTSHGSVQEEPAESRRRRRWVLDPPEELLRLLETAEVTRASSTFLIKRGEDPLLGPLAQLQGDDFDGPEPETEVDERRFQPRSDDEDTDFEEECHCDWMNEGIRQWRVTWQGWVSR
uniref:Protein kinase domain-containing protein n=1 Tax=Tetraodon nigroviridis TaxID=99883 RepID=H3DNX7_TETNG